MGVETKQAENFITLEGQLDKTGYHIEDITNDDVLSSFIV